MEERDDYPTIPQPDGSKEASNKEANACPVLQGYWCFDRACGIDHKTQCMMINPKDKIYIDGGKDGDYIQQNIAFRREMERNYAKTLEELASLKEENERLRQSYKYIHESRDRADKELDEANSEIFALKEVVKELLTIAEAINITVDDPNWRNKWRHQCKVINRAKTLIG